MHIHAGLSVVVLLFLPGGKPSPENPRYMTFVSWDDVPHLSAEEKARLEEAFPTWTTTGLLEESLSLHERVRMFDDHLAAHAMVSSPPSISLISRLNSFAVLFGASISRPLTIGAPPN